LSDVKRLVTEILRAVNISQSDGDTSLQERCPCQLRQRFLLGKRTGDMLGLSLSILQLTIGEVKFGPL